MNRKDIIDHLPWAKNYGISEIFCLNNQVHITSDYDLPKNLIEDINNRCKVTIYRNYRGIFAVELLYHGDTHITSDLWRDANSNLQISTSNITEIISNNCLRESIRFGVDDGLVTTEVIYPKVISDDYNDTISCITIKL